MDQLKIDEDLIERGKALHRLMQSEDFHIVLDELSERIQIHKASIESCRRGVTSDSMILSNLDRYQALGDFRRWISEQIEEAGVEILKQQKLEKEAVS